MLETPGFYSNAVRNRMYVIPALLWLCSQNRKKFRVWGADTFPGGDRLTREAGVYGSVHENSKISSHKPFSFFSYALQVNVRRLVYIAAQFIFHDILQNLTSLFLKKQNIKFRLLTFQWYISLVMCHLAMGMWSGKCLTRQFHHYVHNTECIYTDWDGTDS